MEAMTPLGRPAYLDVNIKTQMQGLNFLNWVHYKLKSIARWNVVKIAGFDTLFCLAVVQHQDKEEMSLCQPQKSSSLQACCVEYLK